MNFWGEGGSLRKSTNIHEIDNSRGYHASELMTRIRFEPKNENVQKDESQTFHNVFITVFIAFSRVHFHEKMVISFKPLEVED